MTESTTTDHVAPTTPSNVPDATASTVLQPMDSTRGGGIEPGDCAHPQEIDQCVSDLRDPVHPANRDPVWWNLLP